MITAATSGGLGDIVYAIPVMKRLNVEVIYVKESYYFPPHSNLYLAIRELLESQGFKVEVTSGQYPVGVFDPKIRIDYNMDTSLKEPKRGLNHIILSYLNCFNLPSEGWTNPWLTIEGASLMPHRPFTLIHRTPRWRKGSPVDWQKVRNSIRIKPYFIGFDYEWKYFCTEIGHIEYLATPNIMEMARLIRDCEALYCNQSVALTLAQGMGKPYYLETKPRKTNCLMYTKNEHVL